MTTPENKDGRITRSKVQTSRSNERASDIVNIGAIYGYYSEQEPEQTHIPKKEEPKENKDQK